MNPFGVLINQTKDSIAQQKIVIANGETDIQLIRIEAGKKAMDVRRMDMPVFLLKRSRHSYLL